jgi:hypothetical protein
LIAPQKINDLQKRIYANGGFRLDVATTPIEYPTPNSNPPACTRILTALFAVVDLARSQPALYSEVSRFKEQKCAVGQQLY